MMLLDRLLEALIGRGAKIDKRTKRPHKVLLFSQFTRMLDIIEVCRSPYVTIGVMALADGSRECRTGLMSKKDG